MYYLEHRERLNPFGVLAYASVDVCVAGEGQEEQDAAEEEEPEQRADGIVRDEVLLLQSRAGR